MRRGAKPTKAKVKAKPPLARRSPKDEGSRVHDLEKRLAEAVAREAEALKRESEVLEQQAATAEILRSISAAPTDYQPVFDTIVRNAGSVCGAVDAILWTADGDDLVIRAHHGPMLGDLGARQPIQGSVAGRALSEARVVHVENLPESDDFPHGREVARRGGWHTTLSVPLLRQGVAVGAILIRRNEVRPFTPTEITLLQTFADQAVIAIENVRLFNETREALERQTATGEILRVIASTQTDLQPVFQAIADSAVRLCDGAVGGTMLFDGELVHLAAHSGFTLEGEAAYRRTFPLRPTRANLSGRAIADRAVVHVPDVEADPSLPISQRLHEAQPWRAALSVPMLRDGQPIGAISVARLTPGPFSDKQIALMQAFADQAVIAIENVRLFTELNHRNRALTDALDRQTATAEVLRAISGSPTDARPVFETIAANAVRLTGGVAGGVYEYDGDLVHLRSMHPPSWRHAERFSSFFPRPLAPDYAAGRVILDRASLHVADLLTDPDTPATTRVWAEELGLRSVLWVPLFREGDAIGVVSVVRSEPGRFSDDQVGLLETFADQAVIAIENVRLFTELEASNRELTTALDTQTATSDILRVISRSQTDVQPVFDTILASAVRLLGAYSGGLTRLAGEQIELTALTSTDEAGDAALRATFPQPLHSEQPHAQVIRARVPRNIADAQTDPGWPEVARAYARVRGYRSAVVVPLLRHDEAIGAIGVNRREPGGFTDDEIALLKTFADQAVIAIENARLLSELQARTQELTRSVEQLTALGDVGRAVSSSLDLDTVLTTIVGRAVQLSGTDGGTIFEYDESTEQFSPRATLNADEGQSAMLRATRLRRGEGAVGQMAVTREPLQIPDIAAEGAYESRLRGALLGAGTRALLAIPLLHEDRIVGGLVVSRRTPGAFTAEVVEILTTFATQSALAIQNARLFHEIERKSRELEVASQHKSEFLANMSHELRTPLNAIIGFSEVLMQRMFGELNAKQDEYLKDIYESGQHLLSLINDILDLSKIEAGRMELELADFDLPSAIDNALTLVRERASRRGITLGHSVDERLGPIRGDERKVKQVLLNLLSNALKFTPEGGRIDVSARVQNGASEIAVTDTGVGIAPEDQEAVFEEFRQVGTADKKVEGTGLGLALSRKFIELHGGKIWVKSQVGHGSTFTFTLPVRCED